MIAWFKKWLGRGSKVDLLVRALPNPPRVRAGVLAWAEATKAIGDRAGRWEPEDSLILDSLRQLADAADLLGPMVDGVVGADKRAALVSQLRLVATTFGVVDAAFDAFWDAKGSPVLEQYIARLRALGD